MLNAFLFSALAQAPLILGGLLVYWFRIPIRVVGWLGGFGAGALVSAIAYNLVVTGDTLSKPDLVIWLMVGAVRTGADTRTGERWRRRGSPVERPLARLEQVADVVEAQARPEGPEVAGQDHEGRLLRSALGTAREADPQAAR